ncbi:DHH family phosphoesterase [Candidatus Woesearchaeota archaeon]|nr:DHH family phosphoesterase [Candidatus Woesearchaeota archaeon]
MSLQKQQIETLRKALEDSVRPLFFFDDDPDGLTAFLLLYRFKKEGHGVIVKSLPCIDVSFLKKVEEYQPDTIFVLDVPSMDQDFIDKVKVPIFWIDHHKPQNNTKVYYCNPRVYDDTDNRPTNYWAYQVVQQDTWIALVGCIADWYLPEFAQEFPALVSDNIKRIEDALFTTKAGKLARIFSFILKGKNDDVMKSIKVLTRITDAEEILEQKTAQGKFIYKRFEKMNKEYEALLGGIGKNNIIGDLLFFSYQQNKTSMTSDLANELQYRFPGKVILMCREHGGEMKCSLRAQFLDLAKVLEKSLVGIEGYGGGHKHACGACIKSEDFERFKESLKENITYELKNQK